jgi:hypothetical protein
MIKLSLCTLAILLIGGCSKKDNSEKVFLDHYFDTFTTSEAVQSCKSKGNYVLANEDEVKTYFNSKAKEIEKGIVFLISSDAIAINSMDKNGKCYDPFKNEITYISPGKIENNKIATLCVESVNIK